MEFSRHEYWNGLPFPSPENLPNPGNEPMYPVLAGRFFIIWTTSEIPQYLPYLPSFSLKPAWVEFLSLSVLTQFHSCFYLHPQIFFYYTVIILFNVKIWRITSLHLCFLFYLHFLVQWCRLSPEEFQSSPDKSYMPRNHSVLIAECVPVLYV